MAPPAANCRKLLLGYQVKVDSIAGDADGLRGKRVAFSGNTDCVSLSDG